MQGRDKVLGSFVGNRGPLYNRGNTRSSPHLSVVTLGCLNEETRGVKDRVATQVGLAKESQVCTP